MTKAEAFLRECAASGCPSAGIGANNTPVIHQFLEAGAPCNGLRPPQPGTTGRSRRTAGAGRRSSAAGRWVPRPATDADLILRTPGMKPYLPAFEKAREAGIPVTSEMELFFELCPARFMR